MPSVEIDNRHPYLRVLKPRLRRHLVGVLRILGKKNVHVDVSLVTDDEIQKLNQQFRGINAVTDVLSFALEDGLAVPLPRKMLGDIVISLDTAWRQAAELQAQLQQDYGLAEETLFLATHGLLHLLGHDHQTRRDALAMQQLERQLISEVTRVDVHANDRTAHGL